MESFPDPASAQAVYLLAAAVHERKYSWLQQSVANCPYDNDSVDAGHYRDALLVAFDLSDDLAVEIIASNFLPKLCAKLFFPSFTRRPKTRHPSL